MKTYLMEFTLTNSKTTYFQFTKATSKPRAKRLFFNAYAGLIETFCVFKTTCFPLPFDNYELKPDLLTETD